jgi:potassium efflux system protein
VDDYFSNVNLTKDVLWNAVGAFWNFRVATIDNNDVTIANIVIALFIFTVGFRVSRKFSRFVVIAFPASKSINENTKSTVESVTFYFLLIIFTFTSLSIAQIPLKSFALLGGALAIGFGFGSQNIIKNFISGIILMIEQPIRVGDIINAEGTEGRVLRIGARSTHIKTYDNIDILVPNSTLLENNVVNWTLSDDDIRTRVFVGVAYGTDTRRVEELLAEVVGKNPKVLVNRPVISFFNEFGDNSLNFEVQFWCQMPRPSARRRVESEVRHDISAAFAKEGIEISFPQRDVHLDTLKPLEVRMVG